MAFALSGSAYRTLADSFTFGNAASGIAAPLCMILGQNGLIDDAVNGAAQWTGRHVSQYISPDIGHRIEGIHMSPEAGRMVGNALAMVLMGIAAPIFDMGDGYFARRSVRLGFPRPSLPNTSLARFLNGFFGSRGARWDLLDDLGDGIAYAIGGGLSIYASADAAGHPYLGAVAGLLHAASALYRLRDFSINGGMRLAFEFAGLATTVAAPLVISLCTLAQKKEPYAGENQPWYSKYMEYLPVATGVLSAALMYPMSAKPEAVHLLTPIMTKFPTLNRLTSSLATRPHFIKGLIPFMKAAEVSPLTRGLCALSFLAPAVGIYEGINPQTLDQKMAAGVLGLAASYIVAGPLWYGKIARTLSSPQHNNIAGLALSL